MSNLKRGSLDLSDVETVPTHYMNHLNEYILSPGDLVLGMSGSLDNWAVVPASDASLLLNQRVGRFRLLDGKRLNYRMLDLFIISQYYEKQVRQESAGAAQLNISSKQVEATIVPLPPLSEQDRIVERYKAFTHRIAEEIAAGQKLDDIKRALMDDLLTGRVRVTPLLEQAEQAAG
jgi:type I restriction enzyme S subunit